MLPSADHYQYFSHLFHSNKLLPLEQYTPLPDWNYPENELERFNKLFADASYVRDCRVLDLGCHTGYLSYIAKCLGAKSIHGINARSFPLEVANYAYSQFGIKDFKFEVGNIENLDFLKTVCQDKDTLILTEVLEHLRNPYAILEIVSQSTIKNLIFEGTICSDNRQPVLEYYLQSTDSAFSVYDNQRDVSFGAVPSSAWMEMVLYHFGWKIEYLDIKHSFNKNWFAVPGLTKFTPRTSKFITILCKKFDSDLGKNNFEN